jgi:hypothetical protein
MVHTASQKLTAMRHPFTICSKSLSPFVVGASIGSPQSDGSYQPNYSSAGMFQNSFGQVTSTTDLRTMEFVLRIHF